MSDICELLRVVSLNAASRYMAGIPSITDDSQIIMDAKNEIERLRARVAEYKLAHEGSEAVIHMAIARLGGLVEGLPTHRGNFLQRIDELVAKEAGNE